MTAAAARSSDGGTRAWNARGSFVLARAAPALLSAVVLTAPVRAARADMGEPVDTEAQRLVHMLGYVAWDYGGAVSNGVVTSQIEYAEQIGMLDDMAEVAARLQPVSASSGPADLTDGVAKLRALVDAKAGGDDVAEAAIALRDKVATAFRLADAPLAPVDAARGAALYAEYCAACHGPTGHADTPRAASLDPRPIDFHDPAILEPLSPVRIAASIRFGVNGTAMVPFTFLSNAERWNLAFHVAGLRHVAAGAASSPPGVRVYSMVELAVRSDADLRGELAAAGVPGAQQDAVLAELRLRAPYAAGARPLAGGTLQSTRAALDAARVALRAGDARAARAALAWAELNGLAPAEVELRALDGRLSTALADRALATRATLAEAEGASRDTADEGLRALLRDATYAEATLARPGRAPGSAATALAAGGLLLREAAAAALLVAALAVVVPAAGRRALLAGWVAALPLATATWLVVTALGPGHGRLRALLSGAPTVAAVLVLAVAGAPLLAARAEPAEQGALSPGALPARALPACGALLAVFGASFAALCASLGASLPPSPAALAGGLAAALLLAAAAVACARLGRRATPVVPASVQAWSACLLCLPLAGHGVAALELVGLAPTHLVALPRVAVLGLQPTVEACAAQGALLGLALLGAAAGRRARSRSARA